jgi:hypothetical protein
VIARYYVDLVFAAYLDIQWWLRRQYRPVAHGRREELIFEAKSLEFTKPSGMPTPTVLRTASSRSAEVTRLNTRQESLVSLLDRGRAGLSKDKICKVSASGMHRKRYPYLVSRMPV